MDRRTFFGLGITEIGALALPGNAWALKYFPRPSDKKWAVLYATWCGSAVVFGCWYYTNIAFLWYNVVGCVAVVVTGLIVTALDPRSADRLLPAAGQGLID